MQKKSVIMLFAAVAVMLGGCAKKASIREVLTGEVSDSIPEAEKEIREEMLPDTVYPSARTLKYEIETGDELVSSELNSIADMYKSTPGAFTFRKGSHRDADFGGTFTGVPTDIVVDWTFRTSESPTWGGGTGWTGQPLYVEWPDSCMNIFRQNALVSSDFSSREIIVGSLSGSVYFIDYDSGKASRNPIDRVNPIKGTLSLDPSLNGNLYVGQGIPDERPFGAFLIDLYSNKVTHFYPEDKKAQRHWGAYDSSPVRVGQFLFRPGENGTLYKFVVSPGSLSLHSLLRYTINGKAPGMEASMGVYRNYGFIADNAGTVLCINLNTLKPVWRYDLGDDVDHSLVVEVEDGVPYVYTGCEIDKQVDGVARFVKLRALDGELVWKQEIKGKQATVNEKSFDGGFYATSLPGRGNCSHLIFANCVLNTSGQNGEFVAFNRSDGKIAYTVPMKTYAWSSPVGFINDEGREYVVTGDCAGQIWLIDGINGNVLVKKKVGNNFESSPVVVGSSLVVGTRGNAIYKMSLR